VIRAWPEKKARAPFLLVNLLFVLYAAEKVGKAQV
jgi:hypothetical protein